MCVRATTRSLQKRMNVEPTISRIAPEFEADRAAGTSASRLIALNRALRLHWRGDVSQFALLTRSIPMVLLCITALVVAGSVFPGGYNWRTQVISKLTSPHENPHFYVVPSMGIILAMLAVIPFAGYVAQRLDPFSASFAALARVTFALSFGSTMLAMVTQMVIAAARSKLHNLLAYSGVGFFIVAMLCCSFCGLKDRFGSPTGKTALPRALTSWWFALTLFPIVSLIFIAFVLALGQLVGIHWAEDLRQLFRGTIFWRLAFWEWFAITVAITFFIVSMLLLPVSKTRSNELSRSHFLSSSIRQTAASVKRFKLENSPLQIMKTRRQPSLKSSWIGWWRQVRDSSPHLWIPIIFRKKWSAIFPK